MQTLGALFANLLIIAVIFAWPVSMLTLLIARQHTPRIMRGIALLPLRFIAWKWSPERIDAQRQAKLTRLLEEDLRDRRSRR